jgi:DNA-damage-inducible protein D
MAKIFEYVDVRNFLLFIERSRQACKNIGHEERNHFVEITEMVNLGSGA